jgi:twitching motility two-component system response regulator PilH
MAKVILVIEDDPDQRKLIESIATASGFRVFTAPDGEVGLEAAKAMRPDLIILDVMMPRMNGYQACRALRQHPETANTPILMLTVKHEPADEFWAAEVGATTFLTKPASPRELLAAIKSLTEAS